MAIADDITRLTAIMVRQVQGGPAALLRQQRGLPASAIGKLCGASADQVYAWESGISQPTCQQGLAWLIALYETVPTAVVAMNRSSAAEAKRNAAERAAQTAETVDW